MDDAGLMLNVDYLSERENFKRCYEAKAIVSAPTNVLQDNENSIALQGGERGDKRSGL